MVTEVRILVAFGGIMTEDDWEGIEGGFWGAGNALSPDLGDHLGVLNS